MLALSYTRLKEVNNGTAFYVSLCSMESLMTKGKAVKIRDATCVDWDCKNPNEYHNHGIIVAVNGHERLLYELDKVHRGKPFAFPHPYNKGAKAPSDKYDKAKAWKTAKAGATKFGTPMPHSTAYKCPRCQKEESWKGSTYGACPECNIIFNL